MAKKLTIEEFIKKAVEKHGIKFNYSKVIYDGINKKVIIICDKHGEFEQIASQHLYHGCINCRNDLSRLSRKILEEFGYTVISIWESEFDSLKK